MTTLNVTSARPQVLVDEQQLAKLQSEFARRALELERLKAAFEILAAVNAPARFIASAMALCNELASRFKAERVGVGFLRGRYVRLQALSHTEKITRHMQLVQDIEAAMEECIDQDVEVIVPPPKDASFVYRASGQLAAKHGPSAVISFPLRRKASLAKSTPSRDRSSDDVAVLTLERAVDRPFTLEEIETLRLTCDLFTARLVDLYEQDRWIGAKLVRETRKTAAWAVGPKHTWAKVAAILISGLLAYGFLVNGRNKVEGSFVLEATEQQIVPAPFDGFLKTVHATAGDMVLTEETGEKIDRLNAVSRLVPLIALKRPVSVLATLNTAEIDNKLAIAKGERLAYMRQADLHRHPKDGRPSEAEGKVDDAMVQKAEAEIKLYTLLKEQATLKAPVDGVVLMGDLKTRINGPVKIGEELFHVGEREKIRAEISVPEDQITDIKVGYTGELAAASFPGERIPFRVERVNPIATVSAGHNNFKVRVVFKQEDTKPWMRPGMEGIAKVDVGEARQAWIWTHRLVNWVRMKLWI